MLENDRRREHRVRSRGPVLLITEDMRRIPATVCDVSNLGMRLEIAEALPLGLALRVDVHGVGASAIVRHCIVRNGKYEVGVHLAASLPETRTEGP